MLRECPVVITGMGVFSAAGCRTDDLWHSVSTGRSPARWKELSAPCAVQRVALCKAPPVELALAGCKLGRRMDRAAQLALAAALQAWANASLHENPVAPQRIGVMVGSSRGPKQKWIESLECLQSGKRLLPSMTADTALSCISGAVALALKARGPNVTVSATCASAASAIAFGAQEILLGNADVILAGGSDAVNELVVATMHASGVLGFDEDPAATCRPFDLNRNGLLLGEGAAFVVLESAQSARRRSAHILGRLAGWSTSTGMAGRTEVDKDGRELLATAQAALAVAGFAPDQIDYVNTHGTGTKVNDRAEAAALARLFNSPLRQIPCSSTKPVTGHCLGASPAIEAVISILAMQHGCIPPTINHMTADPECPVDVVPNQARRAELRAVMSTSLGFWGNLAALVFARA